MHAIDGMACAKRGCDNRGKLGLNIVGHGSFPTKWGRRWRYRCTVCGGTVSTNTGTAYSGIAPDRAQEPRHLRPLQHHPRAGTTRGRGPAGRLSGAAGASGAGPSAAPRGRPRRPAPRFVPPPRATRHRVRALLHESSLARTMPTGRILTGRCDTTLVGRGRSSDSRSHSRGRPHSPVQLGSGREGHRR